MCAWFVFWKSGPGGGVHRDWLGLSFMWAGLGMRRGDGRGCVTGADAAADEAEEEEPEAWGAVAAVAVL